MVELKEKREAVELLKEKIKVSSKRACYVFGLNRWTFDCQQTASKDEAGKMSLQIVIEDLRDLAFMLFCLVKALLKMKNAHKGFYFELKLQLKHRRGKKKNNVTKIPLSKVSKPNQI